MTGLIKRMDFVPLANLTTLSNDLAKKGFDLETKLNAGKILDGGCGRGMYVVQLQKAGFDCYGIDSAKNKVDHAKRRSLDPEKITVGNLNEIPFEPETFDVVLTSYVFDHNLIVTDGLTNYLFSRTVSDEFKEKVSQIYGEIYRVLKPYGMFIQFDYLDCVLDVPFFDNLVFEGRRLWSEKERVANQKACWHALDFLRKDGTCMSYEDAAQLYLSRRFCMLPSFVNRRVWQKEG